MRHEIPQAERLRRTGRHKIGAPRDVLSDSRDGNGETTNVQAVDRYSETIRTPQRWDAYSVESHADGDEAAGRGR